MVDKTVLITYQISTEASLPRPNQFTNRKYKFSQFSYKLKLKQKKKTRGG